MESINNWTSILVEAFSAFGEKIMGALPSIVGAFAILFVGWIVARITSKFANRVLNKVGFNKLGEGLQLEKFLGESSPKKTLAYMVSKAIYWIIFLLFIVAATEVLGWNIVSHEFNSLLGYLPSFVSAIILLLLGILIGRLMRDTMIAAGNSLGMASAHLLGQVIYYIILLLVVIMVLDQAHISTAILTNNTLIILSAALLAFALAYGLATKDVLGNLVASFALGDKYQPGQHIRILNTKGYILLIGKYYFTLKGEDEVEHIFPIKSLVEEEVEVFKR